VNILLDECVDRRLARELSRHSVTTVPRHGWAGIKNGDLLARAQKEFDVLITVDRKLAAQLDLTKFKISLVLIRARTNRIEDIRALVPELLKQLPIAAAGKLAVVGGLEP
jgi:predicted nuclease of predicted toxin-antitoxin system